MRWVMRDMKPDDATVTPLFVQGRPMRDPVILNLLTYWEKLRAGRIAPFRSEFDPRELNRAFEHTFILEAVRDGDVRFRLAGARICDLMGMELRGMPPHALIAMEFREAFDQILAELLANPQIVELSIRAQNGSQPGATGALLLLPMLNDAGEIKRVLGGLSFQGATGQLPRRFEICGKKQTRIVAVDHDGITGHLPGFAEQAAAFCTPPLSQGAVKPRPAFQSVEGNPTARRSKTDRTRPYLRIVKDD
jgi:hypothetical protein